MSGEVSIAELIGWEPHENGTWFKPPGEWFYTDAKPTVDDLLAWLHSNAALAADGIEGIEGCDLEDGTDGWEVSVWIKQNSVEQVTEYFTGPTLLAALEAAVRYVAERNSWLAAAVPAEDEGQS